MFERRPPRVQFYRGKGRYDMKVSASRRVWPNVYLIMRQLVKAYQKLLFKSGGTKHTLSPRGKKVGGGRHVLPLAPSNCVIKTTMTN